MLVSRTNAHHVTERGTAKRAIKRLRRIPDSTHYLGEKARMEIYSESIGFGFSTATGVRVEQ